MRGITKNNKHSYKDFEMILLERLVEYPKKRKIKQSVPFMNGEYDFSEMYGSQSYDERSLKYKFGISANSMNQLMAKKQKIINWLYHGGKSKIIDDAEIGYYFWAEVEGDVSEKIYPNYAEITVNFIAYPFKISEYYEGNNIWDTFNFELDVLQENKFAVNGSKNITLHNVGCKESTPTIICSNDLEIIKNGTTYKLKAGQSKDYRFTLDIGENNLTINGTGTIEFKFKKELI